MALRRAGLGAINVSLDSTDAAAYEAITRGGRLPDALGGIRAARETGFAAPRINSVLLSRHNGGGVEDLVRFAAREGCEIRFIELMPCGEGARFFEADFLSASEVLRRLVSSLEYVGPEPRSATAQRHRLRVDGIDVVVGFITAVSEPFCRGCDRLRLDSRGQLVSCLRASGGVDIIGPLRHGDTGGVRGRIRSCVERKRPPGDEWPERPMVAIGG
jgi:cyclic pyranopterin phosphate synthase